MLSSMKNTATETEKERHIDMTYNYQAIKVERKGKVAVVTINQPQVLNALVQQVFDDLAMAAVELAQDDSVKAVVLTGAGRAFCAGGDLNRFMEGFTPIGGMDYVEAIHPFVKNWINMKKPTIAAVNGPATGAGMSLMLMCDLSIAADNAKIGCAFVNMGLIPDCSLAYFLPRAVGVQKAKELIFTGRLVKADEAERIGLVNQVVPAGKLMDEAMHLADTLANGPAYAIRMCKKMVNMGLDMNLDSLLSLEAIVQSGCFMTEDSAEAVDAFLNKRKPVFKGR